MAKQKIYICGRFSLSNSAVGPMAYIYIIQKEVCENQHLRPFDTKSKGLKPT